MSVTEVLGGLGQFRLQLLPDTPRRITDALAFFGHIAVLDGRVDVDSYGDELLTAARYVGVVRQLPKPDTIGREIVGAGMVVWLGDEDDKGAVFETELDLSGLTLAQSVAAALAPANTVTVGTIHSHAGVMPTGSTFLFVSPRAVLQAVCDAFGVEFRVNGDGSVDVGTAAELYEHYTTPTTIVSRRASGSDVDLSGLAGTFDVDASVYDWSDRVVLVGQRFGTEGQPDEQFVTAAADVLENPYVDLNGVPVRRTRIISDSTANEGTADSRAQLNINRFGRVVRSLRLSSSDYDIEGRASVGDRVYVYDPEQGITDPSREVTFRGRVVHPDVIRLNEATWTIKRGMTVAYRAGDGTWYDLSPFVTGETTGSEADELVVGDLPRSLSRANDSILQARIDAGRAVPTGDLTVPSAPTGLVLSSEAYINASGDTVAFIEAAWTAPTTNTDGSALTDLSHYLVQYRWTGRAFSFGSVRTADTAITIPGLAVNLPYEVQVAAVDTSGNQSAWTLAGITTEQDDIPPPAPADPVLVPFLGQLRINYTGTDATGDPMPVDTKQINVHVGVPGFVPDASNRTDALPPGESSSIISWTVGDDVAVRFVAEDRAGNLSQPSAEVIGQTALLGDGEIGELSIGKLITGVLNAVMIVGDRIVSSPTGITTGKRTEMWPGGFRGFRADETQTIDLNGESNLLVGELRTGFDGERRIEIGAYTDIFGSGQTGGLVKIIAEDGTLSAIQGFTSGGVENLYLGIPITGAVSWNGVQIQQTEAVFAISKTVDLIYGGGGTAGSGAFIVESTTNKSNPNATANRLTRYLINSSAHAWYTASGGNRRMILYIGSNSPGTNDSPVLYLANGYNYGGGWKFTTSDSAGNGATLVAVTPDGGSYTGVTGVINNVSDATLKEDITDATGVLDEVRRTIRPVRYRWKNPRTGRRGEDTDADVSGGRIDAEQFGLLAQEVPEAMRVRLPDGILSISVGAGLAYALGSVRELADTVDELRAEVAALKGATP